MQPLVTLDARIASTRPLWRWLGQVALIVLGAHLACDRLDDALAGLLGGVPLPWPDPQTPFTVGAWTAVILELGVAIWAVWALVRTAGPSLHDPRLPGWKGMARAWAQRVSVHNLIGPLSWLPISLAGCWTIAMAVEDALPAHPVASWAAYALGGVVAWRLAAPAFGRLVLHAPIPKRRIEGWPAAVPLLIVAGFAAWYGLPVWGLPALLGSP